MPRRDGIALCRELRDSALDRVTFVDLAGDAPAVSSQQIGRRALFATPSADRHHLFVITRGEDTLLVYGDEAGHDAHCRRCGSLLYSVVRKGAFVHVAMGTLVDDPSIRPTAHIFVGSKAPWFVITDDLPQYQGHVVAGK